MSGSTAARSVLVHNEQTKLLANYLDRAATAVGVGAIFPVINLLKPDHIDLTTLGFLIGAVHVLIFWSAVLHYFARRVLRGLQ